jgi:ATP-dependent DNA helicase RecQ
MNDYAESPTCRMSFLRGLLDDAVDASCGRCDNCTGVALVAELDPALVAAAQQHLRAQALVVDPRKRWPYGLDVPKGNIAADERHEQGRALSVYGDGGWGSSVRACRTRGELASDELLDAGARLITAWGPEPAPTWVAAVPSVVSALVADTATRLADRLGLPFVPGALERKREDPPQREMANSAQQVTNVYGAFAARGEIPDGPVLLIDDIVDSGWTLTVVARTLRRAGSGPVLPFVLAKSMG